PLCSGLSKSAALDDRRTVGSRDHAAHHTSGEFAARGRADRQEPVRAPGCRRSGRPTAGRGHSRTRVAGGGTAAPGPDAIAETLRGSVGPAVARSGPESDAGAGMAGPAPGSPGNE